VSSTPKFESDHIRIPRPWNQRPARTLIKSDQPTKQDQVGGVRSRLGGQVFDKGGGEGNDRRGEGDLLFAEIDERAKRLLLILGLPGR
jgi:hypothetical protein